MRRDDRYYRRITLILIQNPDAVRGTIRRFADLTTFSLR